MKTVETAVILAAGLGSRLGDLKEEKPKAFLTVGNETLIHRSVRLLLQKGIKTILIGTGYKSEYFESLKLEFPQIYTHHNHQYDHTGSMYTLFLLRKMVKESFLLLEGDLLYESGALDKVIKDEAQNIILGSTATHSGDEVFIQCNDMGHLEQMSKDRNTLSHVSGELVGISKLSIETFNSMCLFAEDRYAQGQFQIHYEDAMVGVAKNESFYVKVENNLAWCEIDDPVHLKRAVEIIYPLIQSRK